MNKGATRLDGDAHTGWVGRLQSVGEAGLIAVGKPNGRETDMKRQHCGHRTDHTVLLFITWCSRCSGWRIVRSVVSQASFWDTPSTEAYESHFLPQEETSPDELQHLIQRAFRAAQELNQDAADYSTLDPGL